MNTIEEIAGRAVLVCAPDGAPVRSESDALALLGETYGSDATWLLLPVSRLDGEFFRLASGLAGGVTQKFVNYRMGLAIMGDIEAHLSKSAPLRDFVREANRGGQLWFVADRPTFEDKLRNA